MAKVKVEDPFAQPGEQSIATTSQHSHISTSRTKRISVDIDEVGHRALKMAAAERGVTIADVVRQLVHDWTQSPT